MATVKDSPEKKVSSVKTEEVSPRYHEGVGRRKTATARVRIVEAKGAECTINDRKFSVYFPTVQLREKFLAPAKAVGLEDKLRISVHVAGGGPAGQASASSLGLARAIIRMEAGHRAILKAGGFLVRDARKVERKKPGLKKARRAPQWSKR